MKERFFWGWILRAVRFEPVTAGREARSQPLCCANPLLSNMETWTSTIFQVSPICSGPIPGHWKVHGTACKPTWKFPIFWKNGLIKLYWLALFLCWQEFFHLSAKIHLAWKRQSFSSLRNNWGTLILVIYTLVECLCTMRHSINMHSFGLVRF